MRGMSVQPTAKPLPFTPCVPSFPRLSVRLYRCLLRTDELFILLCFLALLIVDGRSECPLAILSLLSCDYAAGLFIYALHVLMSMCHFCSSAGRSWMPFPP